jgi:hypothetical protein
MLDEVLETKPQPVSASWSVERWDPRLVRALTILGFAVPSIAYLVVLSYYQVNAVVADQWDDVALLRQSYSHFPDLPALWHQHVDNRMLFPNIIVIVLAHTVAFNIEIEEFLSALMLFAATALLIWAHRRRSGGLPLLFYVPVAFLMLTFAQWQNMLWGFQLAWYLVLLSLSAAIALLDRLRLTWPIWLAGVLVAIVGSYSSLQGLIIWPVGLFLLYHRRRHWQMLGAWVVAAAATTGLYFYNFTRLDTFNVRLVTDFPALFVRFFVYALGDIVGEPETANHFNPVIMAFGVLLLVFALLVTVMWGIRRDSESGAPIGVGVLLFGLLFDAFITQGRFFFGYAGASASRYTTYNVLVLVGIYLATLSHRTPASHQTSSRDQSPLRVGAAAWIPSHAARINGGLFAVALAAVVVQVIFSFHFGLDGARYEHRVYVDSATITRNIDHEPDSTVTFGLYFLDPANVLRAEAHFLRSHNLSLFG